MKSTRLDLGKENKLSYTSAVKSTRLNSGKQSPTIIFGDGIFLAIRVREFNNEIDFPQFRHQRNLTLC